MRRATHLAVLLIAVACPLAAQAACSLNVVGLNFGAYSIFNTLNTDFTTNIAVTCSSTSSFTIALSSGAGTFASRKLVSGSRLLSYNLYQDAARLTVWGDGSPGTATVSDRGKTGNYTVYGRIPARQNAFVGSYSDTITVTITF